MIWTTRKGRQIEIEDLSDGHLNNIIAMFDRTADELSAELISNDNGISTIECIIYPDELFPIYNKLVDERNQRLSNRKE